jgi:hypothetical protein
MHSAKVRARAGRTYRERWLFDEKFRKRLAKQGRRFSRRLALGAVVLERNGDKYDRSMAYAIGERIDEGAIQEIMRKMFYPPTSNRTGRLKTKR